MIFHRTLTQITPHHSRRILFISNFFFRFFPSISFRCLSVNEDKEGIIDSIPTVKHRHYHHQFDRIILYLFYARLRIVENPSKSHVYHATIASHNRWIYFIWFDDLIRIITYIVIESMRILIWKMIFFSSSYN